MLFDGATFIVEDDIRLALLALELPTINIHPAVYIDTSGQWNEDYWYVAFHDFIACIDRARSRLSGLRSAFASVLRYSGLAAVSDCPTSPTIRSLASIRG